MSKRSTGALWQSGDIVTLARSRQRIKDNSAEIRDIDRMLHSLRFDAAAPSSGRLAGPCSQLLDAENDREGVLDDRWAHLRDSTSSSRSTKRDVQPFANDPTT